MCYIYTSALETCAVWKESFAAGERERAAAACAANFLTPESLSYVAKIDLNLGKKKMSKLTRGLYVLYYKKVSVFYARSNLGQCILQNVQYIRLLPAQRFFSVNNIFFFFAPFDSRMCIGIYLSS